MRNDSTPDLGPQKEQLTFKSTKSILVSLLIICVAAILISAATYASFSDTETSEDNTFTAGTLDLKVDGNDDPIARYFNVSNAKPGDTGNAEINLNNSGSIDGSAHLVVRDVVNTEGTNPEPETDIAEPGDLGPALLITIEYDANGDGDYDDTGETIATDTSLNDLDTQNKSLGTLSAGVSKKVKISWSLPATTGNEVQGDEAAFDIEFSLNQ